MNSIKIFESEGFGQVRVLTIADEPWFVPLTCAARWTSKTAGMR